MCCFAKQARTGIKYDVLHWHAANHRVSRRENIVAQIEACHG